jgi:hypothetical protein
MILTVGGPDHGMLFSEGPWKSVLYKHVETYDDKRYENNAFGISGWVR